MSKVKAGFARVCSTPPLGTPMAGYFEPRYAKGVLDDLFVNAVAFEQGEKRCVVISVDLCGLMNEYVHNYRKIVADYCGIPFEAVIISCTHSHTGPVICDGWESGTVGNPVYDEWLGICMRDAAKLALEDVCDAEFYAATGEAKGISFVRRFLMKDGSVLCNPGINNPNVVGPIGEPNETVYLLKIEREAAEDIYIVNYGVHPDTIGGEYFSADFPGVVRDTIEAAIPDSVCMFIQGPEGDVNHVDVNTELKPGKFHAYKMGRTIAGTVLQICMDAKPVEVESLEFVNRNIDIPANKENDRLEEAKKSLEAEEQGRKEDITIGRAEALRIVNLADAPDTYPFILSAVKVGNVVIGGLAGEPFTEIGVRIREKSPFDMTILCALTDGGEIYFPTSDAYDGGSYEVASSYIKRGADNIIVEETLGMFNEIKSK